MSMPIRHFFGNWTQGDQAGRHHTAVLYPGTNQCCSEDEDGPGRAEGSAEAAGARQPGAHAERGREHMGAGGGTRLIGTVLLQRAGWLVSRRVSSRRGMKGLDSPWSLEAEGVNCQKVVQHLNSSNYFSIVTCSPFIFPIFSPHWLTRLFSVLFISCQGCHVPRTSFIVSQSDMWKCYIRSCTVLLFTKSKRYSLAGLFSFSLYAFLR